MTEKRNGIMFLEKENMEEADELWFYVQGLDKDQTEAMKNFIRGVNYGMSLATEKVI